MRIVACEYHRFLRVQHFEHLHQVLALVWLLDRLRAEVAIAEDVLTGQPLQPWHLRLQGRVHAVEAPHHIRCPADATLDETEAKRRELFEQSLAADADT